MATLLAHDSYVWPVSELRVGLESLVTAAGYPVGRTALPEVSTDDLNEWLTWLAEAPRSLGLVGSVTMTEKEDLLATLIVPGTYIVTADIDVDGERRHQFVTMVSEGWRCRVIGRGGQEATVSAVTAADFVVGAIRARDAGLERIFAQVGGGARVLQRITERENLLTVPVAVFSYRADAASPLPVLLASTGGVRDASIFVVSTVLFVTVTSLAAVTLGSAALDGLVGRDRILAWVMISLVAAPLAYWSRLAVMRLTLSLGSAVKRRLLEGTFFLDEGILRREGYGTNVGRMSEASLFERLSISDVLGLFTPLALTTLSLYLFVTTNRHWLVFVVLQALVLVGAAFIFTRAVSLEYVAYGERVKLGGEVVEKVLGHRTRAVQEHPASWHTEEDRQLSRYALTLRKLDAYNALGASAPRIWLLLGGGALATTFVQDGASAEMLYSSGAIVLFAASLASFAAASQRGAMLVCAWQAIRDLLVAGRGRPRPERPVPLLAAGVEPPTVLATSNLAFSYRQSGGRVILRDASLRVQHGERLLLEGPSGGGKSTFVKILAGELRPSSGSVLVSGLDPFTGSENQWRRLVASVPQFHENHIFSQTFAFNVDPVGGAFGLSAEALEICAELDLDQVLERMPAKELQLVGETGWQLSHGERSRVFIARALLQRARLVILDESFAALDPETMQKVIGCVRRRAPTLIVVAHV